MKDMAIGINDDPCASDTKGRALLSVEAAIERATALAVSRVETESLSLEAAIGRVLAQDLTAPIPLPPFDNSAMDGYALRSGDLTGDGPWRLRVVGRVAAGDDTSAMPPLQSGEASRIFTGAAIPHGADAVIMQEHVTRDGEWIVVQTPVPPGDCVRRRGEDSPPGARLLPAGTLIGAREIGAIASVGLPQVEVRQRVRIALFCTGSELRQPGEPLNPGQIYNSNRYMMLAALKAPWIDLHDMGAVADDPDLLRAELCKAADQADMIVTTGGVSVGEEDHMVAQLGAAGGQIEVMKVAMKPGKPLSVGTLGKAVFVGLPGNPVAAFTAWKIIGTRVAERLAGQVSGSPVPMQAEIAKGFSRRPGRQEFRPARVVSSSRDGRPQIEMLDKSYSAKMSLICASDGLAVIPASATQIEAGQKLDFLPL